MTGDGYGYQQGLKRLVCGSSREGKSPIHDRKSVYTKETGEKDAREMTNVELKMHFGYLQVGSLLMLMVDH